jgi:uncharacterized protein YecE (DUF72 family)
MPKDVASEPALAERHWTVRRSGAGTVRVGISGWRYSGWRGSFYPPGLPQRRELEWAAGHFPTVEINGTFYSLQRPAFFRRWYEETPPGFVFSVKGARFITHMKRLNDIEAPLANFFASGVLGLEEKLGPILWQFPPTFRLRPEKLEPFFRLLPRDTEAAAELAKTHDKRLNGRALTTTKRKRKLRYAIEIRHDTFKDPEFVALLRAHDMALVIADAVDWPYMEDLTSDFVYARLHGSEQLYVSGYSDEDLDWWAKRVVAWAKGGEARDRLCVSADRMARRDGRDVFIYFDNDAKVRAPYDAQGLIQRIPPKLLAKIEGNGEAPALRPVPPKRVRSG